MINTSLLIIVIGLLLCNFSAISEVHDYTIKIKNTSFNNFFGITGIICFLLGLIMFIYQIFVS